MFFDLLKSLYTKVKIEYEHNTQTNITLSKWTSLDKKNIGVLNKLVPFLFYLEPKHFFYILFFSIAQGKPPFFNKIEKEKEKKPSKLLLEAQKILQWSDRELAFAEPFLTAEFSKNEKHWKMELGL